MKHQKKVAVRSNFTKIRPFYVNLASGRTFPGQEPVASSSWTKASMMPVGMDDS